MSQHNARFACTSAASAGAAGAPLARLRLRVASALGPRFSWLVWLVISLLAFNQSAQTFAYPVLVPSLLAELGLSYSLAGGLMSAYVLAMASVMLPVGLVADRIGGRALTIAGLAVLSLGALLFATANSYPLAVFSRALVGVGAGVAIVLPAPMLARWFSPRRYPSVLGAHVSLGKTGSIVATWVLAPLIGWLGWRGGYAAVSLFGPLGLLAALLFLADEPGDVRIAADQRPTPPRSPLKRGGPQEKAVSLRRIIGSKDVLMLAAAQFCFFSTYYGAINWLPTYFKVEVGLSEIDAGFSTGFILWGTIVGFALSGPAAGLVGGCRPLFSGGLATTAALTVLFAAGLMPSVPAWLWPPLMLLYGFCLSNMVLMMPILATIVPSQSLGTANGFVFSVAYIGAVLAPPAIGATADASGSLTTGLWLAVASGVLGFFLSLFVAEGAASRRSGPGDDPRSP